MDKYYVIIAGYGETSRANVEALIEDYVYANGNDVVFVLPYEKKPTAGQTFVSQWAKDKSKDIVIFANEDAKYDGLSSATVNYSSEPYKAAVDFLNKKDKAVAFILWSDTDPRSNEITTVFSEHGVKCHDLTDGLNLITVGAVEKEPEPIMPEVEKTTSDQTPRNEEVWEEEEEYEEEEEDEEDELLEEAYFGLQALVKAIAREVVNEMNRSEKPSKGSKA